MARPKQGGLPPSPEGFDTYHRNNPQVWILFKKFTLQVIGAGYKHYGAAAIFQRIRWHINVETKADPFKVNNNFVPYYSRMFMVAYPEYNGFFRRRESHADALFPPGGGKLGQMNLDGMEDTDE